ncbi:MAG: hypothetical protein ACKV2Q_34575 [Planctomycetaceae bacterium]
MGKLSDILRGNGGDFNAQWNNTEAAREFGPVPRGVYVCHVTKGELDSSRPKATPGYKIEFTIREGEFKGRKLWLDCWLTPAALPQSKRDLGKLGITSPNQMEQPLPKWIRCNVTAVVRRDDDDIERNKVRTFEVVGIDKPESDPFSPKPPGDAAEPDGELDTSFDPSKL